MKSLAIWSPTNEERESILSLHNKPYDGYAALQSQGNLTPLSTQDYRIDQQGMTLSNTGKVKGFSNVGINESIHEAGETCEQCGGTMNEGECSECGYGGMREEDELDEQMYGQDIYDEEDLNPKAGFDYIEGSSNDVDTFEGMHKNLYKEDEDYNFEDMSDFKSAWADEEDIDSETDWDMVNPKYDENDMDDLDYETDWEQLGEQYDEEDPNYDFMSGGPEGFAGNKNPNQGIEDEYELQQDELDYESQHDGDPEARMMIANLDHQMDDEYSGEEDYDGEKSPYDFVSGGPFDGGVFANESVDAQREQKMILEMFERMKKFL